jgi:hypothetical protein
VNYAHLAISIAALTGAAFIAWTAPDRIASSPFQSNVPFEPPTGEAAVGARQGALSAAYETVPDPGVPRGIG